MRSFFLSVFSCFSLSAFAIPSAPTVISGTADFDWSEEGIVSVTCYSDQTIIEWESFSLSFGEQAIFELPGDTSSLLNRMTGTENSTIDGAVMCNGLLYLVNEEGIAIGASGSMNTASGFISSLGVSNEDFLLGEMMNFQTIGTGVAQNSGAMTASLGDLGIMGFQVANNGSLVAAQGRAAVAAATNLTLYPPVDQLLLIIGQSGEVNMLTGTLSTGVVTATQVEIKADGNLFAIAVDHSGVATAIGTETFPARVIITGNNGVTYANGGINALNGDETGGTAYILGTEVVLYNDCLVNCSGNLGGGSTFIGGGFEGSTLYVRNALNTVIYPGAYVNCDALMENDGGEVVVWADDTTNFYGSITSRGGADFGNGGTVEVSGVNYLNFAGTVDNSAANGMQGELILDPIILEHRAWESN